MKLIDYIRGIRKGKNAHDIEYDAMSDPFLADAIEGFDSVDGDHAKRIAQMQAAIVAKTTSRNRNLDAWKVAVAVIAFISLLSGYFLLMNHESSMMVASCDHCFINIYAPEDYIERKRLELTLEQEQNPAAQPTAIVNIENLKEVIVPVEHMTIYLPGNYAYAKNTKEDEELTYRDQKIQNKEYLTQQNKSVTIELADNKDEDVLNDMNSPNNMHLWVVGKPIMLTAELISKEKEEEIALATSNENDNLNQKDIVIRGKLVDEIGYPIIGASILEKGTSNGTVTDLDGNYSLTIDSETALLIASYIGYETLEIPDPSKSKVVALKPNNDFLDEVVVTGYGSVAKNSLSGSISNKKLPSEPIIGRKAYVKYINENRISPKSGECADIKGYVILEFTVGMDGSPQDIRVVKTLCDALDQDAIHLLQSGSKWTSSTEKVKLEIEYK